MQRHAIATTKRTTIMGRQKRRDIQISADEIAGLGPFLFAAQQGSHGLFGNRRKKQPGHFLLADAFGSGLIPYNGLVLPLSTCSDSRMKAAFLELRRFMRDDGCGIDPRPEYNLTAKRAAAQRHLDANLGGAVQLHEKNRMSGFLRFKHTDSLFPALAGRFDYVVSLATQDGDRLAGPVYAPFAWNSYGSFLEWFHAPEGYEVSGWNHVHVFAVFDPPELFHFDFNAACLLERPSFDPSRHFVPAPGVEAASLEIRMEQDESSGCVDLVLRHADGETTIGISEVFQPVGPLLEWLRGVDSDDLPLCLTIEDEGPTWRLEAYPAGAPDLMLLRVHDPYDDTGVPLECLLDQMRFVEELRTAMRDFFASGFQPDRWSDGDDAGRLLKKRMLSDPWLMRDDSGALPRQ